MAGNGRAVQLWAIDAGATGVVMVTVAAMGWRAAHAVPMPPRPAGERGGLRPSPAMKAWNRQRGRQLIPVQLGLYGVCMIAAGVIGVASDEKLRKPTTAIVIGVSQALAGALWLFGPWRSVRAWRVGGTALLALAALTAVGLATGAFVA